MSARVSASVALASALLWSHPVQAQCQSDTDCRAGRVCRDGTCGDRGCTKDLDCPGSGFCQDGGCQIPVVRPSSAVNPETVLPRQVERRGILGLWLPGLIVEALTWMTTIGVSAVVSDASVRGEAVGYSCIPVLGPFIMLGNPGGLDTRDYQGALVASGIVQIASTTLFVVGLVVKHPVEVTALSFGDPANPSRVTLQPTLVAGRGWGLALSLTRF
jgi:hypothetical protein